MPIPMRNAPEGSPQTLVGLRIGAGWNSEIRKRLLNCDTCTHLKDLKELLGPLASTAIQTTVLLHTRAIHAQHSRCGQANPENCIGRLAKNRTSRAIGWLRAYYVERLQIDDLVAEPAAWEFPTPRD